MRLLLLILSLLRFRVAICFLPSLYSRVVSESWSMMACLWGFEKIFEFSFRNLASSFSAPKPRPPLLIGNPKICLFLFSSGDSDPKSAGISLFSRTHSSGSSISAISGIVRKKYDLF